MRRLFVSLLLTLSTFQFAYPQNTFQKWEAWDQNPQLHSVPPDHMEDHAFIIRDDRRLEFLSNSSHESEEYASYQKIIHINDEKGLELLQKIPLDLVDFIGFVDFQARIILPGGKIISIGQDRILVGKENEGGAKFLNTEGIIKGAEIEIRYMYHRKLNYFGREIIQTRIPCLSSRFEIISPSNWIFVQRPYNFQPSSQDSSLNEKRMISFQVKDIPTFVPEVYSTNATSPYRIEYKWTARVNSSGQREKIFTYSDLAKKIYSSLTLPSQNPKLISLINEMGWKQKANDSLKIIAVENFIKTKFQKENRLQDSLQNTLDPILEKRVCGNDGVLRLMGAIFTNLGIDFQFVFLGDHNHFELDPNFSNWSNGGNYLIYFPSTNQYLAPTEWNYRYPWFPFPWGNTQGLFCNDSQKGGLSTLVAEIGAVDLQTAQKNYSNIEAHLEFNKTLDTIILDNKFLFGGYPANKLRVEVNSMTKDEKSILIKSLTKRIRNSESLFSSEIVNLDFEKENSNQPFIIHTKTKSKDIIKNTGGRINLKLGMLLGLPIDMPSEPDRKLPVIQDYGRINDYKIQIKIPKGYTVKNTIELMKDQNFKENDENTLGFSSGYEQKGDILYIHAREYFTRPYYQVDHYPIFQSMINASNEFKRIVLIFEKNKI